MYLITTTTTKNTNNNSEIEKMYTNSYYAYNLKKCYLKMLIIQQKLCKF